MNSKQLISEFKDNIKQEDLSEIIFKFSDGKEAKFRLTRYKSWIQYGDVLLDSDLLDRITDVINVDLIAKEVEENTE